jgi:hypothetical protein
LEVTDSVDSGDEGKQAGAAVVCAVGEGFDDAVEGSGGDVDEDFAVCGRGVGEGGVDGRGVEGLNYGGVHGRLLRTNYFSLYRFVVAAR